MGFGGFGNLILTGFNNNFYKPQIMAGTLGCLGLALIFDLMLIGVGRVAHAVVTPHGGRHEHLANRRCVWLNDPLNWTNPDGILARTGEHLEISAAAVALACLVAWPIGIWLGHTGRGGASRRGGRQPHPGDADRGAADHLPADRSSASATRRSSSRWPSSPSRRCWPTPTSACARSIRRSATRPAAWACPGRQVLTRVELPLAVPYLASGFRTAAVQVVATATLAAFVNGGGLGMIISRGFGLGLASGGGQIVAGGLSSSCSAWLSKGCLAVGRASGHATAAAAAGDRARAAPVADLPAARAIGRKLSYETVIRQ